MSIHSKILETKRTEVQQNKELYPAKLLEKSAYFTAPTVSLRAYLERPNSSGVIAEIKRKSPSKGVINKFVDIEQLSIGYMQAGAAALSVLTDSVYFGGSKSDLTTARRFNYCPILRKDFIIDEYQVVEARSIGADVILLIAAALTPERTLELARFARSLQLEVLLEVHTKQELATHLNDQIDVLGVNNRNLDDFSVSLDTSLALSALVPSNLTKISESGIETAQDIARLKTAGFKGFLIGERFMRSSDPARACAEFISKL